MTTQQYNLEWNSRTGSYSNGLATLFFLIGAPHIYGAMRTRAQRRFSSGSRLVSGYFARISFLAVLAGLMKVFVF